ncbi:hypothetical protein [Reichenbachiella versicolor]|uniref:hypothetical protein n=1 Tax=Reichenbachiella versicolor TaxID=1821036 RepID=UPI000D6E112B|nr:hypothetical protein [Reichenbachiella versicolor]
MSLNLSAQKDVHVIGESMKSYIKENHLEKIEDMIHHLSSSNNFVEQFVEEEKRHLLSSNQFHKKNISIGDDLDIFVKHFTEHQNYTMILVPISIYSAAIYDTLLFSVLEVTDTWIEKEFPYDNIEDDSIKSSLLSLKNHDLFAQHLYEQALKGVKSDMGRFKISVKESYITANSIHTSISKLTKDEKDEIRRNWGLLKKALSHDVNLNIELNMYVFGFNDMEVHVQNEKGQTNYKINPSNIFTRHQFQD